MTALAQGGALLGDRVAIIAGTVMFGFLMAASIVRPMPSSHLFRDDRDTRMRRDRLRAIVLGSIGVAAGVVFFYAVIFLPLGSSS